MGKLQNGLSGKPVLRSYEINSLKATPKSKQLYWQYVMSGVFIAGALTGGVIMANDKISQADQLAQEKEARVASAVTTEQWSKPLEFSTEDLEVVADMLPVLIKEERHEPTPEELANQKRKDDLRAYFQSRKSPFAAEATLDAFLNSKNMKLMIAISFVESTMGKKCYYNNCSGIGGTPPKLRKYDSHADWVRDFDSLLERRYKGMDPEDMMGVYVQPGSPNWINGVRQILAELANKGIE